MQNNAANLSTDPSVDDERQSRDIREEQARAQGCGVSDNDFDQKNHASVPNLIENGTWEKRVRKSYKTESDWMDGTYGGLEVGW